MDVAWPTLAVEVAERVGALRGASYAREVDARRALVGAGLDPKQITTVLKSAAATDPDAGPLKAKKGGGFEPDAELRDQENIPLPPGYLDMSAEEQVEAVRAAAEKHLAEEVHPYVPDAWIDHTKTRIGYEIPFTRQFYVYTPPRPVAEIRAEIDALEEQIQEWMRGLVT